MSLSKIGLVWGGLFFTSLSVSATTLCAQECGCSGVSQGAAFETPMSSESEAEMLLREVDDPLKTINLTVVVQDKAIVTVNGEETYTKGTVRPYIIRGLAPGKEYTFLIDGLVKNESGAQFTAKEEVKIKAGDSKQVVLKLHRSNRPKPAIPAVPAAVDPAKAPAK
jgi:uncharacterized protein (TIGR03000 family)